MEIREVLRVRISMVIVGEPAKWLLGWKRRGFVTSYTDAIIQALRAVHEIVEQDLKLIQLRNMREVEEEWWMVLKE